MLPQARSLLNREVKYPIAKSPKVSHASMGILFGPRALPFYVFCTDVLTSSLVISCTKESYSIVVLPHNFPLDFPHS